MAKNNKEMLERYTFFERMRKRSLYKEVLKAHNLSAIRSFIAAGGDPRKHPDLSAEYYYLINEYGNKIFGSEIVGFGLVTEDDTLSDFET